MSAQWTVLVYMQADDDLAHAAIANLEQMTRAARGDDVQVLVQLKTPSKERGRYQIRHGKPQHTPLPADVDMGKPEALTEFVDWALERAPARHTALVVWGHGGGWEDEVRDRNLAKRGRSSLPPRAGQIGRRPHVKSYLTDKELRAAIHKTKARRIDVVGYDACEMAMVEIARDLREAASFLVASEGDVPQASWPYEKIVGRLVKEPELAPRDLAHLVVDEYDAAYKITPASEDQAISAIDLASVEALTRAIDALVATLSPQLQKDRDAIMRSRSGAYTLRNTDYVDLESLVTEMAHRVKHKKGDTFANAAKGVQAALAGAIVAKRRVAQSKREGTVSIYFPESSTSSPEFFTEYRALHTGPWATFLGDLFAPPAPDLRSTGVRRRTDVDPARATPRRASSR